MTMNAIKLFTEQAIRHASRTALFFPNKGSVSFSAVFQQAASIQRQLKSSGLKAGDTVLLFEGLNAKLYSEVIAMLGLGITVMLVEPWMAAGRIKSIIDLMKPKAFVTSKIGYLWGLRVPAIRQISRWLILNPHMHEKDCLDLIVEECDPSAGGLVGFTSGTTGEPKGVPRTQGYLINQHQVFTKSFNYNEDSGPDLCIFANFALSNLACGRTSIIIPSSWAVKDLKSLNDLPKDLQPRSITSNPAFFQKLLRYTNLKSFEHIHLGGALVDCGVFEHGFKQNPNAHWAIVYGSTEAEPISLGEAREAVELSRQNRYWQTLCLGKPIAEITAKLEENTAWISGPHVCQRYIGCEAENLKNKREDESGVIWHKMGDRIKEKDGYWWYAGREQQPLNEFELEQQIYWYLKSSAGFISSAPDKKLRFYGEENVLSQYDLQKEFPQIRSIRSARIIRDSRHRSRIDRQKSKETIPVMRQDFWTYMKERFPVVSYFLLSGGMAISSTALVGVSFNLSEVLIGLVGLIMFFMTLRAMDEVKDYDKDILAHPLRPLPRGLLTVNAAKKIIWSFFSSMMLFDILLFASGKSDAGVIYLAIIIYLYFMYVEFFVGEKLSKMPFLYAFSHQAILVLLTLFPAVLLNAGSSSYLPVLYYGMGVFGAFFSYEISRKLDPSAHPVLSTYRVIYGVKICFLAVFLLSLISFMGFYPLNLALVSLVSSSLLLLSYVLVIRQDSFYKWGELFGTINLLCHIFAPAIYIYFS